ncbi:hypothetical protein HNP38_001646 [Chryseobacterium defluvii]|uniref:Secretion system C-terminal sorting domain-containing protein n=1 Tax=Chryseobacterium defluvii TaxID=160396 RepID=A0A840KF69_9FLAO|nr:T9SS type A sorting domain-containing protein [Chryseobacterium defluvii]MBB4806374.1 hypothetical protein [Chryseobacterium defluvii]
MKKFYSLIATAMFAITSFAQTTIYSEDMGTATATTAISANTFQNGSPITYSGTADVRATNASSTTNYPEASAGANVMVNAASETFIISGIDTTNYTSIQLSFGQRKGATAANNELTVEVSSDGTNWTALSYSRPTGSGTATWAYISPTGTIPSTANLSIRFTGTNGTEWRIDDVKLVGTSSTLAVNDIKNKKGSFIRNTYVDADEIVFGSQVKDVKIYNMYGQIVKTSSKEGASLNVSELTRGNYIVTGTVNGEAVSQKVLKK